MENYNCRPPSFRERIFQRTKPELQDQDLRKCLTLFDLIVQGLAHIVGGGIYVTTPGVIATIAGPSLVFSYMISAVVLMFTVVCYMDLGSRYRGIGNAYVYVYASIGEVGAAFVWVFLMAEIALGKALLAVGFGQNFDTFLMNNHVHDFERRFFSTFLVQWMADNFNSVGIVMLLICCVINCVGIKQVTYVNMVMVGYSIFALCCYFLIALIYGNFETFSESRDPVSDREGVFPYGFGGMIQGSAVVFVSFAGFESIVTLSAEAKQPRRDVPIAMLVSYTISVCLYIMTAFAMPYLSPWYTFSDTTGISDTLRYHNLVVPMYFAIAAVLFATFSVCICSLTTLARILFMVASDGMFFKVLANIAKCSQVPVVSIVVTTMFCIFLSVIFSYNQLIHLVSGGTIITFVIINFAVVVISYTRTSKVVDETSNLVENMEPVPGQVRNVVILMAVFTKLVIVACLFMHWPVSWPFWTIRLPIIAVLFLLSAASLGYIRVSYNIQTNKDQLFVCPFVPFFPAVGMLFNLILFSSLDHSAHYMTIVYVLAGVVVYAGYGYFNSELTVQKQKDLTS